MTQIPDNPPTPGNPKVTIGKPGAVARLVLEAVITFLVAIQAIHQAGTPVTMWAILGAGVLTLKDVRSFISTTWSNAFGQTPDPAANVPSDDTQSASLLVSPPAPPADAPAPVSNWNLAAQAAQPAADSATTSDPSLVIGVAPVITEKSPGGDS